MLSGFVRRALFVFAVASSAGYAVSAHAQRVISDSEAQRLTLASLIEAPRPVVMRHHQVAAVHAHHATAHTTAVAHHAVYHAGKHDTSHSKQHLVHLASSSHVHKVDRHARHHT